MKRMLGLLAFMVALSGVAKADPTVLVATLSGANENPAVVSAGTGTAVVTLNGDMLTVNVTFSGLTGLTTASHIHCCAPLGTNAGVATTTPTFAGFPLNVTSGTYLNTLNLTLASSYNPAFITAHGGTLAQAEADLIAGLLGGQSYLNVHSTFAPGGEIRGQLQVVPEPMTILLLGTGLLGGMGFVRKKRKGR